MICFQVPNFQTWKAEYYYSSPLFLTAQYQNVHEMHWEFDEHTATSCSWTAYVPIARQVEFANVLVFGPAGAGKSSFIRSIDTIIKNRFSHIVDTGTGSCSLTTRLQAIILGEFLVTLESVYMGDRDLRTRTFNASNFMLFYFSIEATHIVVLQMENSLS